MRLFGYQEEVEMARRRFVQKSVCRDTEYKVVLKKGDLTGLKSNVACEKSIGPE